MLCPTSAVCQDQRLRIKLKFTWQLIFDLLFKPSLSNFHVILNICQRFIFYLSLNHPKSFRVRQTHNCIVCTIFSKSSSALKKNRLVQNKLNKNFSNKSKMQKVLSHLIVQNFQWKKHKIFIENVGNILSKTLICVLYQKACEKIENWINFDHKNDSSKGL